MGTASNDNRRKILVVDKIFQLKLIFKFWSLASGGAILTAAAVYGLTRNSCPTSILVTNLVHGSLIVIAAFGTIAALTALYISHRIAGPVYRIKMDIESLTGGNFKQTFRLRDKDELKALIEPLNNMGKKLREDMTKLKAEVASLEKMNKVIPPHAQENVRIMKKILDQYQV